MLLKSSKLHIYLHTVLPRRGVGHPLLSAAAEEGQGQLSHSSELRATLQPATGVGRASLLCPHHYMAKEGRARFPTLAFSGRVPRNQARRSALLCCSDKVQGLLSEVLPLLKVRGWLFSHSPICLRCRRGISPLPIPVRGGTRSPTLLFLGQLTATPVNRVISASAAQMRDAGCSPECSAGKGEGQFPRQCEAVGVRGESIFLSLPLLHHRRGR